MPFQFKPQGVYRIFNCAAYADFSHADVEFEAIHRKAAEQAARDAPLEELRIAVVDSGIYVDQGRQDDYFQKHWVAGRDFTRFLQGNDTMGRPDTMGKHGSCVASIAGFGSTRLKLIDAMVERTQEGGGAFNADHFVSGVKWALRQGARVVNCSKQTDWADPKVGLLVSQHRDVLFIDTAGNNAREFKQAYRTNARLAYAPGVTNTILVGGCNNDATPSHERGYGEAVDVMLPSYQVPCLAPRAVRMNYFRSFIYAKYEREEQLARRKFEEETARVPEAIREFDAKIKNASADVSSLMMQQWENKLKNLRKPREYKAGRAPLEPEATDVTSDDGTSFACPMVANIAAKMLLINPQLPIPKLIDILVRTSDKVPALKGKCRAGGVVNPVRAYQHALLERPNSQKTIHDVMRARMESLHNHPMVLQAQQKFDARNADADDWD